MSSASPIGVDRIRESIGFGAKSLQTAVSTPVRFVGFWLAVLLPFVYVPLLFTELQGATMSAFLALICVHVVSLALGKQYNQ